MIELRIIKIDGYNYYLVDKNKKMYNLNIEFYDVDKNPSINDLIYINEKMLSERVLSFGSIKGIYGRNIESELDEDILVIKIGDEYIFLKRYYG